MNIPGQEAKRGKSALPMIFLGVMIIGLGVSSIWTKSPFGDSRNRRATGIPVSENQFCPFLISRLAVLQPSARYEDCQFSRMNTSVLASDESNSVSVSHLYSVNTFRWALDSDIAMGKAVVSNGREDETELSAQLRVRMGHLLPDGFDLPALSVQFGESERGALLGECRVVCTSMGYPFLDRSSVLHGRIFEDGRTMFLSGPEFPVSVPSRIPTLTTVEAKVRLFASYPQHEKNGDMFLGWFEDKTADMRLGYVFVRSDSTADSGPFHDVGVVVDAITGEIIEISSWPYLDRRERLFPDP